MTTHRIVANHALALALPQEGAEAVSDFLFGERVTKEASQNGFVRVRNEFDGYEGWVPEGVIAPDMTKGSKVTFRVRSRLASAHVKPGCDVVVEEIGVASPIHLVARIEGWVQDASGLWFREEDLAAVPADLDRVDVALELVGVPYVWGGRHGGGIDCSVVVQIGAMLKGLACERDTKDQVKSFGRAIGGLDAPDRQRGDVLYVPGHVAILTGPNEAVHADGKAGLVHVQGLEEIVANRGFGPEQVTIRRPAA